jgi:hypothetical protein
MPCGHRFRLRPRHGEVVAQLAIPLPGMWVKKCCNNEPSYTIYVTSVIVSRSLARTGKRRVRDSVVTRKVASMRRFALVAHFVECVHGNLQLSMAACGRRCCKRGTKQLLLVERVASDHVNRWLSLSGHAGSAVTHEVRTIPSPSASEHCAGGFRRARWERSDTGPRRRRRGFGRSLPISTSCGCSRSCSQSQAPHIR